MTKQLINEDILVIDIFVKSLEDIYEETSYNSLNYRFINSKLEKYLINSVKSCKLNKKVLLVIHIPAHIAVNDSAYLKKLFTYHFSLKVKETELQLKDKFRQWRINLLIGALFISLCFILLENFHNESNIKIIRMLRESLLIVGWVALWEPISFILFGWHPIIKKKLYYKRLMNSSIGIQRYISKSNTKNIFY